MNNLQKTFLSTLITVLMLTMLAFPVLAGPNQTGSGNLSNSGNSFRIPNPTVYQTLEDLINAVTALIRPLFILTFGGMILYGAWVRLTSQGDPGKIEQSMKIIVAAIVGFAIAVFAPSIVDFIGKLIGVQGGLIGT